MLVELHPNPVTVTKRQRIRLHLQLIIFTLFVIIVERHAALLQVTLVLGFLRLSKRLNCHHSWLELSHVL